MQRGAAASVAAVQSAKGDVLLLREAIHLTTGGFSRQVNLNTKLREDDPDVDGKRHRLLVPLFKENEVMILPY
ncbi:hypothetical protein KKHLCK_08565 [Candidatus Electrothrix laxa]